MDGEFAYIGIMDYAQEQLGEVLFVEMPEVGDELTQGEEYGVVESSKVASDLVAPISGEVVEINEKLDDEPEYINEDAYDAWIVKIKVADEDELENLLNSDGYEAITE
jgi:glycine cleavage system H protein